MPSWGWLTSRPRCSKLFSLMSVSSGFHFAASCKHSRDQVKISHHDQIYKKLTGISWSKACCHNCLGTAGTKVCLLPSCAFQWVVLNSAWIIWFTYQFGKDTAATKGASRQHGHSLMFSCEVVGRTDWVMSWTLLQWLMWLRDGIHTRLHIYPHVWDLILPVAYTSSRTNQQFLMFLLKDTKWGEWCFKMAAVGLGPWS